MEKDNFITPVIFRKEIDRTILAIFPAQVGTNNHNTCECYANIGQHATMQKEYYYNTKPTIGSEYKELFEELESIGYNLKVYKKWLYKFDLHRELELRRIK